MPIALPHHFPNLLEPVFVSIPTAVGKTISPPKENQLTTEEKQEIQIAAKIIWQTYQEALQFTS